MRNSTTEFSSNQPAKVTTDRQPVYSRLSAYVTVISTVFSMALSSGHSERTELSAPHYVTSIELSTVS